MPSSAQRVARRSRSLGPARVRRATRSPSRAAAAAAYTAVPPMRHSGSPSNSSRAACPIETRSNIKEDVHDLAVLYRIRLSLCPHDSPPLRLGLAPRLQQLVPSDDLGANEAPLEIRVNDARRLLRGRAARHRPRANFVLAGREERAESQQLVRRADQTVERGLGKSELLSKCGRLVRRKLGDLSLDLGADGYDRARAVHARRHTHGTEHLLRRRDIRLVEIDSDEDRHAREKAEATDRLLLFGVEVQIA